jgi:hypothetical protein
MNGNVVLQFPFKGRNTNFGYENQPDGTCIDCLNVMPFDPRGNRLRGGQRTGTGNLTVSAPIGSGNPVKRLHVATTTNGFSEGWAFSYDLGDDSASWVTNQSIEVATAGRPIVWGKRAVSDPVNDIDSWINDLLFVGGSIIGVTGSMAYTSGTNPLTIVPASNANKLVGAFTADDVTPDDDFYLTIRPSSGGNVTGIYYLSGRLNSTGVSHAGDNNKVVTLKLDINNATATLYQGTTQIQTGTAAITFDQYTWYMHFDGSTVSILYSLSSSDPEGATLLFSGTVSGQPTTYHGVGFAGGYTAGTTAITINMSASSSVGVMDAGHDDRTGRTRRTHLRGLERQHLPGDGPRHAAGGDGRHGRARLDAHASLVRRGRRGVLR